MRLTAQLERAEEGIERAREASRSCLRQCEDDNRGHRTIPDDAYDEDGEVDAGAIMCSVCDDFESYDVRNLGVAQSTPVPLRGVVGPGPSA